MIILKQEVLDAIESLKKYKTETEQLEAKSAFHGFPKKCYDTISSFSNKYGGIILFGFSEEKDFETEGVYDVKDLQKQISSLCSDSMEPSARVDILPLEYEGKMIVAVKIYEISQNQKPCYYKPKGLKAGSYIRIGDRDELMTDYEIYALQSYQKHIEDDLRPNRRATLEDLNQKKLAAYLERLKKNKPNFAGSSEEKILKISGIIDNQDKIAYPTLAGTLVFCDYAQSFYPQLFVACVSVPGTELGETGELGQRFDDNKRVEGTLEDMLYQTLEFLQKNMRVKVIIREDGTRVDIPEYPIAALREAVVNALIHRDYSCLTERAYIQVYMYHDRIEIISPGSLFGANKIGQLGTDIMMESRNPTIINLLENVDSLIENRHSGIPTMKREMKKMGLPEPEFYELRNCFKVVFRNGMSKQIDSQILENTPEISKNTPEVLKNTPEVLKNTPEILENTPEVLKNTPEILENTPQILENTPQIWKTISQMQVTPKMNVQRKILLYCLTPKSSKEIIEYLNLNSIKNLNKNYLNPLIEHGMLKRTQEFVNSKNQKYVTIKKQ